MITSSEESYRLLCVVVCDLENLKNEGAMARVGLQRHRGGGTYMFTQKSSLLSQSHDVVSQTAILCHFKNNK